MFSSATRTTRVPARAARAHNVVARAEPINADIRKDEPKVVDMMSTDDMPKKVRPVTVNHQHDNARDRA